MATKLVVIQAKDAAEDQLIACFELGVADATEFGSATKENLEKVATDINSRSGSFISSYLHFDFPQGWRDDEDGLDPEEWVIAKVEVAS